MSVFTEPQALYIHVQQSGWLGFDFGRGIHQTTGLPLRTAGLLAPGRKLVGTPTVQVVGTGFTVANDAKVVNDAQFNDGDGVTAIVADEGVLILPSALAPGSVTLVITCTDDATPTPNTLALETIVTVQGTAPPAP